MTDTKNMRLDFEQHIRDSIVSERGDNFALKTDEFGHYATLWVSDRWVGYQAATERATPQWQPIETAPEQQVVLVAVVGAGVTTGFHIKGLGWHWDGLDDEPADSSVSHWMPLPPPPPIRKGGAT